MLVNVTVHSSGNASMPVEITLYEPNSTNVKATGKGMSDKPFIFSVDSPELWSPNSPTLYNMTVKLGNDTVNSYTGFRTISVGEVNGVKRPLLNGEFIFQFGTLDQGYWPDGLYSPPSREGMVYDLKALKEVGYNMLRKHIKVEPHLFYQACDELGILLIQDMPALSTYDYDGPDGCGENLFSSSPLIDDAQAEFSRQLALMVEQHKSYPSIVTWVCYERPMPDFALSNRTVGHI